MGSFEGLLRKEWVQYRSWLLLLLIAGPLILIGLPYVCTEMLEINVEKGELSFILMFFVLAMGGWVTLMQLISSLRADIRRKEIWLHSTVSMNTLVGVKMLYTIITYLVFTLIISAVGLYLSQEILKGTFLQYANTCVLMILIAVLFYCAFIVIAHLCFVFNLQLKRYVGKFSIFITAIAIIAGIILLVKLVENPLYILLLKNSELSLEFLATNLLTINSPGSGMTFGSIYIVEEIFSWSSLILMFIVSNKWLEKVVTR
ncbi:hypothetical protein [Solibacillus sp. CAU 1738]|uniref:hypothetical protein n=1 Tax=Solibacillus sp. CAU 1738 TaxID=3140363 RepID=UPI003260DFEB